MTEPSSSPKTSLDDATPDPHFARNGFALIESTRRNSNLSQTPQRPNVPHVHDWDEFHAAYIALLGTAAFPFSMFDAILPERARWIVSSIVALVCALIIPLLSGWILGVSLVGRESLATWLRRSAKFPSFWIALYSPVIASGFMFPIGIARIHTAPPHYVPASMDIWTLSNILPGMVSALVLAVLAAGFGHRFAGRIKTV